MRNLYRSDIQWLLNNNARAPLEEMPWFNREERHIVAVLFGLMLQDRQDGLRKLIRLAVPEREFTDEEIESANIFFEFSFLRDWWNGLDKNSDRINALLELLSAFKLEQTENQAMSLTDTIRRELGSPDRPLDFNSKVSSRPSKTDIESPARWSTPIIEDRFIESPDIAQRLVLLAWSFRIKPDLVVSFSNSEVVVFEAKLESKESAYKSKALGLSFKQIDFQRQMMENLLKIPTVHSVMIWNGGRTKQDGINRILWKEAFECFSASTLNPSIRHAWEPMVNS